MLQMNLQMTLRTMASLQNHRKMTGLQGLMQIHHIIPRSCYSSIDGRIDFKLSLPVNLMLMPTKKGIENLDLGRNHLVHQGPHLRYNKFIKDEIQCMHRQLIFDSFVHYLRFHLQQDDAYKIIPWN